MSDPVSRRRRLAWLPAVALLLAVFGVTCATTTEASHIDVYSAELGAWRIAGTGTPWLEDVRGAFPRGSGPGLWIGDGAAGHQVADRSPGVIAAGVPAYLLAGASGDPASFSVLPGSLTAVVLTALAVVLMAVALTPLVGRRGAVLAAGALAFTTPYWSVSANALWPHAVTIAGIAGMAWGAQTRRWWLVGLCGGVALWGRLHTVVITAVLGVGLAWWRRQPRIALTVGSIGAAMTALASLWSHWHYGTWNPGGPYQPLGNVEAAAERGLWQVLGDELGLLVAADRGMLVWTPVLALLAPAVVRGWRSAPDWTRLLAAGGVAYLLVQGVGNVFHGGDTFYGYRLGLETLTCVTPLYVVTANRAGAWARALLGPVLGLQLGAISLGATIDGLYLRVEEMWRHNALAVAAAEQPVVLGYLALTTLLGVVAARAWSASAVRRRLVPAPAG